MSLCFKMTRWLSYALAIALLNVFISSAYRGQVSALFERRKNRFQSLKQAFVEVDFSSGKILDDISLRNESHSSYPSSYGIKRLISPVISIQRALRFTTDLLKSTFLPTGFPASVPPEYLQFQIWNTIQDLCSYLRGIMSTRAVLEGLGVGKADVTAVQATLLWIMRDGASMIGGLLFTTFSSANFGQNAKSWRLFADYINNVGITLDLLAPLSAKLFLPLICLSSVFKSLCGIAAGAAGAVISEHWGSLYGNIAEVNSKNGAQHTAVSLLGLLVSIPFANFASRSPRVMWTVYTVLTVVHIVSNYCAMRTLSLRSINISRGNMLMSSFLSVVDSVLATYSTPVTSAEIETIRKSLTSGSTKFTLQNIAHKEPILTLLLPRFLRGSLQSTGTSESVCMWASPRHVSQQLVRSGLMAANAVEAAFLHASKMGRNYTLLYHDPRAQSSSGDSLVLKSSKGTREVFVCFSETCAPNSVEQLEALLSAHLMLRFYGNFALCEKVTAQLFPLFLTTLQANGWDTQRVLFRTRNARAYALKN